MLTNPTLARCRLYFLRLLIILWSLMPNFLIADICFEATMPKLVGSEFDAASSRVYAVEHILNSYYMAGSSSDTNIVNSPDTPIATKFDMYSESFVRRQ